MISASRPRTLCLDTVKVPGCEGLIGMTACPGKICHGANEIHKRDVAVDLEVIRAWGAEVLVSLLEEREYADYGIEEMGSMIPEGIQHITLPIRDMDIPDSRWEIEWARVGPGIRAALRRGGRICVHCLGGLGRTGTVAARLLVEFGMDPGEAIREVRIARPGAIETQAQERYIYSIEPVSESPR